MSDGMSDILWSAYVDDKTGEFFDLFDRRMRDMQQTTSGGFKQVEESVKRTGVEVGILAGVVSGFAVKLIGMAMDGVAAFVQFSKASIEMRSRADTLGIVLEQTGTQAGYLKTELDEAEEALKQTGITTMSARQSLLWMMQANIDLSESAKLARVAQNQAVIANMNSSQAFERLVRAIQKREPVMLLELGITLQRTDAYERYANQIGKTVKSLNEIEQQEAILQEVYRQSALTSGVYEASMESVGKQITSLPRYIEELQLAIGGVFQETESVKVRAYTETLKSVHKWFEDNEDALIRLGKVMGTVTENIYSLLKSIVEFVSGLPGLIEDVGIGLAKLLSHLWKDISPEEIEARRSKLGEYFNTAISLIAAYSAGVLEMIAGFLSSIISGLKGIAAWVQGDKIGAEKYFKRADRAVQDMGENIKKAFENTIIYMGEATGLIDDMGDGINDAVNAANNLRAAFDGIGNPFEEMLGSIQKLMLEFEAEEAARTIRDMRQAIERELRTSWRIEDIERNFLLSLEKLSEGREKSIQKAMEGAELKAHQWMQKAAERREALEEDYSRRRIDIERNYQRRLEDIRRRFDDDSTELARKRDAVGLLQLRRRYEREVRDTTINRDRQAGDAQENYQTRLQELEEALEEERKALNDDLQQRIEAIEENYREQLESLKENRRRQYEELKRSLDRDKQLQDMRRRWEREDRRAAFIKEIEDLRGQHATLESLQAGHLRSMLLRYKAYFVQLGMSVKDFMDWLEELEPHPGDGEGGYWEPPTDPNKPPKPIIGQGGLVSQFLASPAPSASQHAAMSAYPIPRIPAVSATSSRDSRDIRVTVDGTGLHPYIQRVVANTLLEIERNR